MIVIPSVEENWRTVLACNSALVGDVVGQSVKHGAVRRRCLLAASFVCVDDELDESERDVMNLTIGVEMRSRNRERNMKYVIAEKGRERKSNDHPLQSRLWSYPTIACRKQRNQVTEGPILSNGH
jgi:hypothetical protein